MRLFIDMASFGFYAGMLAMFLKPAEEVGRKHKAGWDGLSYLHTAMIYTIMNE